AGGGRGDRCEARPLRAGDHLELPRSLGGRELDVPHHLLDVEPLRIGLVADVQHGAAVLDPVAVDVAPEELAAMEPPGDRLRDAGPGKPLLPEQRILAWERPPRAVRD